MKIGVISDTHGDVPRTRQAVDVFDRHHIDTILHCGDVGSLAIFELFVGKQLRFVWGNTDRPTASWRSALETWDFPWPDHAPLTFDLADKRIILAHGYEPAFRQTIRNPDADFLFFGHSHSRLSVHTSRCTIVNPGAIHRSSLPTVAIVDLLSAEAQFLDLQGQQVEPE